MARAKAATPGERIASLEAVLLAHCETDRMLFTEIKAELKAIREDVSVLRGQLTKQKSFIGGVIFAVSAAWAVIAVAVKLWPFR